MEMATRDGQVRRVVRYDPVWDALDGKRARFWAVTRDGMVELADGDAARILPDLRHPSQVFAY